ncbi:MAG: secretin N-terminal domain-containing protein, partial [Planctomycetaceae bacterium]
MLKLIRSAHPFLRLCLLIVCFCATISTVRRGWLAAETIPFEVYTLQHAAPEHAQRMLKELLGPIAAETQIVIDSGADQLLVRGSGEAQQITRQLLKELDQPRQSSAAKPLALPGAVVRSYACPSTRIAACATIINERIREHGRVTVDQARGRIVVVAPPEVQEQVSRFVAAYVVSGATQSGVPGGAASQDAVEQTGELTVAGKRNRTVSAVVPIRVRKLDAIRNALAQLLGKRMEPGAGGSFDFVERAGHRTSLTLDVSQSVVRLRGPVTTVSQLTSLLQWLDTAPQPTGRAVRFVPLRNVDPATLTRAIRVWRQTGSAARVPGTRRSATDQSGMAVIQPVEFQQTADEPGAGDSEPVAESAQAETEPGAATPRALRQPLSNVQIDALPDLDVLILRGLDGDVEELTRIIQELERIHEEASPEIEVYLLRHVQGEALTALMSRVLDELAGPLQGRISITPLIKPNGLLLIGWGEAVKAAKQLIAQLDQPVDPQTQMRVFTLKNAAAAQIQGTIQEFLNGRGGLGPNVSVTADPRTNSLIVYAAPRDLLEVARLVERLDTGQTDSVKRVRMIRLKNSLAADIAATLEAAIATARGGSAGQRAAALEMLMVDPSGEKLVRSGLLNDVQITPDSRTNTLFVFGPEDSLPLIEALITELDQNPAASAQIKVFQVINGDAGDLILVLRTLFPQAATSNVPQLATARDEPTLVPVRFSVDVRTNSIIATGAAGDLQIMEALLLRLDEASSSERQTRVYRLKNSPALDVNQAVNEFLRSERIVAQAAPGRLNPFAQIESEVVVVAEPVTNSLIISATPRYFDEV